MKNAAYMHACILVKGFITGKRFKYLDQAISYQECHHAENLLNSGSSKPECLFTMWLRNDLNLAQITFPLPSEVVVALQ